MEEIDGNERYLRGVDRACSVSLSRKARNSSAAPVVIDPVIEEISVLCGSNESICLSLKTEKALKAQMFMRVIPFLAN